MTEQAPELAEEKEEVVVVAKVVALPKDQAETASAPGVAKKYLINREQPAIIRNVLSVEVP